MAATYGTGSSSPPVIGRPIERVFEEAQTSGEINLSGRKLKEYPKICVKFDLADTIIADLSKNRLQELPSEICLYHSIERINCYGNCIKSIPPAISHLQQLTYLDLSRNQLTVLPAYIGQLQSLEVLIAANNKLVSLPEELGMLEKLHEIDVSCNEISHLPLQIGDLTSLRSFNVRRNLLVELPLEISRLNLRKIDFSNNRIEKIPTVFRKIDTLEEIILDNNPLTSPTAHICTKGRKHIMKYLHIEAIKEERKRGILHESEMKRLARKSLPPQQTSDEFRNMVDSPDSKWKRHTVLSSDSGYSTTDSLEKCGWSPSEVTNDLDAANSLALKAAEAVREHRHGRDGEYHRRFHDTHKVIPNNLDSFDHSLPPPPYSHPHNTHVPHPLSPVSEPPTPTNLVPPSQLLTPPGHEDEFTRELQRQKSDYDRRKKLAEQIRIQQEEEEREERRRAAVKLQEEQKLLLEKQRDEQKHREEEKLLEESRRREEETRRLEDARRHEEEKRRQEEIRKQEELQRKVEESRRQEESKHREEVRLREEQKTADIKKPKTESNPYPAERPYQIPTMHDGYNNATYFYPPPPDIYHHGDYTNNQSDHWDYRKTIQSSNSFRDDKKINNNTPYRRTVSDSVRKPASTNHSNNHIDNNNYINRNGVGSQDSINSISSSNHSVPPGTPGTTKHSTPSPATSNPSIARLHNDKKSTPTSSPVVRRAKVGDKSQPAPGRTTGRTTPNNTTPRSSVSTPTTKRSNNITPPSKTTPKSQNKSIPTKVPQKEEEFKKKHQALQNKHLQESQTLRKRLEDSRTTPTSKDTPPQKRVGVANTTTTNNSHNAPQSNRNRSVSHCSIESNDSQALSTGTMKLLEEYKDSNPNFTIRRHHEQQREEVEHLDQLRQTIESRLKVTLPDNLPDALRDGVVLCHLANQIRPRSVASIHVPSPAVPKLTMAKCRRNVENFLEACRKIGVRQDQICSVHDILEEKSVIRVAVTAGALVTIGTNPKQSMV